MKKYFLTVGIAVTFFNTTFAAQPPKDSADLKRNSRIHKLMEKQEEEKEATVALTENLQSASALLQSLQELQRLAQEKQANDFARQRLIKKFTTFTQECDKLIDGDEKSGSLASFENKIINGFLDEWKTSNQQAREKINQKKADLKEIILSTVKTAEDNLNHICAELYAMLLGGEELPEVGASEYESDASNAQNSSKTIRRSKRRKTQQNQSDASSRN